MEESLFSLSVKEFVKTNPSYNDTSLLPEVREAIFNHYNFEYPLHSAFFKSDNMYYEIIERLFMKEREKREKVCLKFEISDSSVAILYLNKDYYGLERYFNGDLIEKKRLSSLRQGLELIEKFIRLSKDIWKDN